MRWDAASPRGSLPGMATDWLDVSATDPRISYAVGPAQTIFTVPFIFFDDTDLVVTVNGVTQVLNVNYTVTGAKNPAGGSVTFLTAQSSVTVAIARDVPLALSTHVPPSGPLDVAGINIQFSKLVAMIQQVSSLFGQIIGGTFISAFMLTLLDDADASTARTTLGLGANFTDYNFRRARNLARQANAFTLT